MSGISFDDSDFRRRLNDLLQRAAPLVQQALEEVGDFVQAEARDRAPIDEGMLTDSIEHEVYLGDGAVVIRVPMNAPAAQYAVPMHEDTSYRLGPLSQGKQARVGQQVGPKYITRAIDENKEAILEIIAENMQQG